MRKNYRLTGRVRAVPRLCELYPGICLTTEVKARKNLSRAGQVTDDNMTLAHCMQDT